MMIITMPNKLSYMYRWQLDEQQIKALIAEGIISADLLQGLCDAALLEDAVGSLRA